MKLLESDYGTGPKYTTASMAYYSIMAPPNVNPSGGGASVRVR